MSDSVTYTASNLTALRNDVRDTTDVLKVTVDKLVDRGDRLAELSARADDLNQSSVHFHQSSRKVHRRMLWQNRKMTIIISKILFSSSIEIEIRLLLLFFSF